MHGLARPVDAAVGVDERVDRARDRAAVDRDLDRLVEAQRGRTGRQRDLEALRHEVLDVELDAPDRIGRPVERRDRAPQAARGGIAEAERHGDGAGLGAIEGHAPERDAVGPVDRQHHRRAIQQHRQVHGLARPVDAAVGVDERVDRARDRAAVDAAVRQIEGRALEVERGEVVVGTERHDGRRRRAALAAQQAGIERGAAIRVGDRPPELIVVDRDQGHGGAGDRLGGVERAREHLQAVGAAQARQRDVGVDHPLGRGQAAVVVVVVAVVVLAAVVGARLADVGFDQVGAGAARLQHVGERKHRGDALIVGALDAHLALPHQRGRVRRDLAAVPAVLVVGLGLEELGARQDAVADPADLYLYLVDVDGLDADAVAALARQDETVGRETNHLGLLAERHRDRLGVTRARAGCRRQTGRDRHRVRVAELEAAEAQPALGRLDGQVRRRLDLEVVLVVGRRIARQRLGEHQAGFGRGTAGVDQQPPVHQPFARRGGRRRRGARGGGPRCWRCRRRLRRCWRDRDHRRVGRPIGVLPEVVTEGRRQNHSGKSRHPPLHRCLPERTCG